MGPASPSHVTDHKRRPTHAVAIGGGHGLARTLAALPTVVDEVTAVVTVADDGGSSGRLRRDLGVLPPGDLRMALTALARDRQLARLVGYRFRDGELAGHSLGNLIVVALQDLAGGDLLGALDRLATLLDVPGRVLPCTPTPMTLHARTSEVAITGQAAVAATPRIQRVWLEPPDPPATVEAVQAIEDADLVVLGPGSLYTSLLPNLLVPGIASALARASAPIVFVGNLREQPGETEGMSLHDHVRALTDHAPQVSIDVLVAHEPKGDTDGTWLTPTGDALQDLEGLVGATVLADLSEGDAHSVPGLADVLAGVLSR